TISDFTGLAGDSFAPAASLTGLNAVGPYASLPIGIPQIALAGGTTPGVYPLPDGVGTTTITRDFRRGYIQSFNLTIEQEFAGFVGDVGYVGSRGIRPLTNRNIHPALAIEGDRKSTRLNSSHGIISYAVFCLKKKKIPEILRVARTLRYPATGVRRTRVSVRSLHVGLEVQLADDGESPEPAAAAQTQLEGAGR